MAEPVASGRERLYSLDAARAIAALAVVFQHWEHFFFLEPFAATKADSPLYWLFAPFYEKGARAVTFFFCLSGFIFYWLYARKVREGSVGPVTFAVLRLSRLYPLHLATLLLVLVLQWPMIEMVGQTFVYQNHDLKHFALNLLLMQYWGLEAGYSFNGPSWSISVEIFLYIAFFLVCRFLKPSVWQCLAFAALAVLLARFSVLAAAAGPFFLGGACYFVYRALVSTWTPLRNIALVALVVLLWAVVPQVVEPARLDGLLAQVRALLGDGAAGDVVAAGITEVAERAFEVVLFPATVLALALSEAVWKRIPWIWLHDLGNMSFGIYLLHFPLELAVASTALAFAFPADFFRQPTTLLMFFALLLACAAASYRWFEKPAMDAIRRAWKRRRSQPAYQPAQSPAANP